MTLILLLTLLFALFLGAYIIYLNFIVDFIICLFLGTFIIDVNFIIDFSIDFTFILGTFIIEYSLFLVNAIKCYLMANFSVFSPNAEKCGPG